MSEALPPQETTTLVPWRDHIAAMVERGAGPKAIYDALRLQDPSFPGSLSAVKRLCLRLGRARGVRPEDVVIPVTTGPGEIAQVYGMPAELLLVAAGYSLEVLLPLAPSTRDALALFESLDAAQQQIALGMLRVLAEAPSAYRSEGRGTPPKVASAKRPGPRAAMAWPRSPWRAWPIR